MCHSGGWAWPQDHKMWVDVMSIPTSFKFYATTYFPPAITPRLQRLATAIGVMHELGHSLGLITITHGGIDNATMVGRNDLPPLQKMKARSDATKYWSNYKSCMNYNKFAHYLMGYSDGSNGKNDYDDWSSIDLTFFNKPFPYNLEI